MCRIGMLKEVSSFRVNFRGPGSGVRGTVAVKPSFGSHGVVLVLSFTVLTSSNFTLTRMFRKERGRLCDGVDEKEVSNLKNGERNHFFIIYGVRVNGSNIRTTS